MRLEKKESSKTLGATKGRLMGSSWVGVKVFANDEVALIPPSFDEKSEKLVKESLGVPVVRLELLSTELHGVMISGNNNGVLLPYHVDPDDIVRLRKLGLNAEIFASKYTALGNLILANSRHALVYRGLSQAETRQVSDVLGVEVEPLAFPFGVTVGSLSVVTEKGILLPPSGEALLAEIERKFGVRGELTTVNMGFDYLRLGIVANSKGALVGDLTTGTEFSNIERGLFWDMISLPRPQA